MLYLPCLFTNSPPWGTCTRGTYEVFAACSPAFGEIRSLFRDSPISRIRRTLNSLPKNLSSSTENVPFIMPSASLQELPYDVMHLILLQMSQRDVGSLRLVSRALSTIGIGYMLRTFPMRLTFEGITRVLALTENLALARHVHTLAFTTHHPDQLKPALSRVIDGYTIRHTAIVEELGRKYVDVESDTLYRKLLEDKKTSERTWPACPVRYMSSDLGRVLGEKRLGFKPWHWHCADPAFVVKALHTLIGRFPALRRIYMEQFDWIYDWKLNGHLSVHKWEPSLDHILSGPAGTTVSVEDEFLSPRTSLPRSFSRRWFRALATWLRSVARRTSVRRRGSRGLFDHLTFFILSDRSYTPFWPVAPKFEHLELNLPCFRALESFNIQGDIYDGGTAFRMCFGTARINVKSISIKWAHVATKPGEPQMLIPTNAGLAEDEAFTALHAILTWDMVNLESLECTFPYGYRCGNYIDFELQTPFLVPLTGTFSPPNIRKLNLSHFATTEVDLNGTLGGARKALRNLKMTRVDLTRGSWVGWFGNMRSHFDQLETAEFCDTFSESARQVSIQMGAVIPDDRSVRSAVHTHGGFEGAPVERTIGSMLGEISLSRTSLDSPLREVALRLLAKGMQPYSRKYISYG